jgi:radical SAM-linked protein
MAYSSGFNPHPRISYAGASPTGAASEAEYLEIGLARETDPEEVRRLLDESLPPGLDVLEVVTAHGGSLPDRMEASHWRITMPEVTVVGAREAVEAFLAATEVTVERMTKKGLRSFDCRAAVVRLEVADDASAEAGCAILDTVLRHATPSVRPDDVLAGLREIHGLHAGSPALLERLAQGPLDAETGTVGDPLAPDRDAV